MINARTILLAAALSGAIAVMGCKKDENQSGVPATGSGANTGGMGATTMPDMGAGATTRPTTEPSSSAGGAAGIGISSSESTGTTAGGASGTTSGSSGTGGANTGTAGGTEANK